MALIYFHKNGRLALSYRNGKKVTFEPLADARSVVALDEERHASEIANLREYIERRIGGVSEIDANEYEALKKSLPHRPEDSFLKRSQARLFNADSVVPKSISSPDSARRVLGQAAAAPAGAGRSAQDVEGAAPSRPVPSPISRGRRIRTGKVEADGTVTESAPLTPKPTAEAGANETSATSENS